jgi:hypothetical protein
MVVGVGKLDPAPAGGQSGDKPDMVHPQAHTKSCPVSGLPAARPRAAGRKEGQAEPDQRPRPGQQGKAKEVRDGSPERATRAGRPRAAGRTPHRGPRRKPRSGEPGSEPDRGSEGTHVPKPSGRRPAEPRAKPFRAVAGQPSERAAFRSEQLEPARRGRAVRLKFKRRKSRAGSGTGRGTRGPEAKGPQSPEAEPPEPGSAPKAAAAAPQRRAAKGGIQRSSNPKH